MYKEHTLENSTITVKKDPLEKLILIPQDINELTFLKKVVSSMQLTIILPALCAYTVTGLLVSSVDSSNTNSAEKNTITIDPTEKHDEIKTSASGTVDIYANSLSIIPNKYIVLLNSDISNEQLDSHKKLVMELQRKNVIPSEGYNELHINSETFSEFNINGKVKGYSGYYAPDTVEELRKNKDVKLVVEDSVVMHHAPVALFGSFFGSQNQPVKLQLVTQTEAPWNLARISRRKNPFAANETTNDPPKGTYTYFSGDGEDVCVYVVDSGVNIDHEEFEGRAVHGASFAEDKSIEDNLGHGTHVAGIVGGRTFGVAKRSTIISVKSSSKRSNSSFSTLIDSLNWVSRDIEVRKKSSSFKGAVVNISSGGRYNKIVNEAIAEVAQKAVVVTAAGNFNSNACSESPASAKQAITVGSTDFKDDVSPTSNHGSCIDLFAPGVSIESAWIGSNNANHTMSGTSMSAPHVAGLASHFMSLYPAKRSLFYVSYQPLQVKQAIVAFGTRGAMKELYKSQSPNIIAYNGAEGDIGEYVTLL